MPWIVSSPPHAEEGPLSLVSSASSAELEASLKQAIVRQAASMERLHEAVDACVAELHGRGMSPESVIVTMKALLRQTACVHPPPGYPPSPWSAEVFVEPVIQWTIIAYFRLDLPR